MQTVTIRLDSLEKVKIPLGFVGENLHRRVIFVCDSMFKQYPSAVAALAIVNPAGVMYPGILTREGNNVLWDIRDSDVAVEGNGEIQLTFTEDTHVAKEYKCKTHITESIVPNSPAPDPVQDWLDYASGLIDGIPDDIAAALAEAKASGEFDGVGIASIAKTGTSGLVDTYTITLDNGGSYDFTVTNGQKGDDGVGIQSIAKTSTSGLVDTYTITLTNGQTSEFTVTNGRDGVQIDDTTPASNKVFSSAKVAEMNTQLLNAIQGIDADVEDINSIIINKNIVKENAAIYLQNDLNFQFSVASDTRVCTNPIYIKNGESITIKANGFGKYGYSESTNGRTISNYKGFTEAENIDLVFEGPKYVRFLFAYVNNAPISTNDVYINVVNRLDNIENFYKLMPVSVIEGVDTYLPSGEQYGYLGTLAGSAVSVYDISNINKIKMSRPENGISVLLSNTLYEGEATRLDKINEEYKKLVLWENSNNYKYLYVCSKRTGRTSYVKLELTKVTDVGEHPAILKKIGIAADRNVISIEENTLGNQIVATYKNMYARNNNGVLQLSSDKGKTWNNGFDVTSLGLIKCYHIFNNGCIAFFTHQHAYYSEDWTTYQESDVFEKDGITPYTPSTYDNFLFSRDSQERKFVGSQDLHVFGNYGIVDENNTRRIIWMSDDNGHSYKVIYEFNVQGAITIRHIHNVIYNREYDRFICCTGDEANQSHVIEINIDGVNDPTFTVKGTGLVYKWAGTLFYGAYVYYCMDNTPGQVKRCKYKDIGDITKHEIILDNLPNDPIGLFVGERGDMLVTLTKYRSNGTSNSPFPLYKDQLRMYYSKDRVNFTDFIADRLTGHDGIYYMFNGVNSDGVIIAGYWNDNISLDQWDKLPSATLDEMVKKAGFPMAFKPYDRTWEIVPVVDVLCDDVTVASGSSVTIQPKLFPIDASSLAFSIIDYDSSVVSVSGGTITGVAQGTTTAKVRSNLCYDAYAEIMITVT